MGLNKKHQIKITAQDLAPFVGLPCAIYSGGETVPHYIEGVDIHLNKVIAERVNYNPEQIKPVLKDLECLTVEDTVFISCDIMGYERGTVKEQKKWHQNDLRDIREYGSIQFDTRDSIFLPKIMEYFTRKGYNLHLLPHGTYLIKHKDGKVVDSNDKA